MCGLKLCVNLLLIAVVIRSGHLITAGPGSQTDNTQWVAQQIRVQRQHKFSDKPPSEFQLHPEKFSQFTGDITPSKQAYRNTDSIPKQHLMHRPYFPNAYGFYRPPTPGFTRPTPALPPGYQNYQQGFTDALNSIAQNDRLQCVPRLLCELVSSPSSNQSKQSMLPFNLDLSSLIGLLPFLIGTRSSPLVEFGKAALLGYTSKGNVDMCLQSYPRCPKDSDQLVEYLNNYNGGFFRFFNGLPQTQIQNPYGRPPYQFNYNRKLINANRRIQNKPVQYVDNIFTNRIKFPSLLPELENNDNYNQEQVFYSPNDFVHYPYNFDELPYRQSKGIAFPNNENNNRNQYKPITMVFPDRTGTGELKLDEEDFYSTSNQYVNFNSLNY